jgi:phage terminase Nu1 subunit (DNA packaging protein)
MPKELLTINAFARMMGVSHQRISQLVKKGVIPINAKGKIDGEAARKIMDDRRKLDDALPMSKTLSDARIRVESIRAEMLELEFRQKRGELIEREKVMHMVTGIIAIAKTKLLSIPTKVAPLIVGSDSIKKIKAVIEKEIRFVLTELSRMKEIK